MTQQKRFNKTWKKLKRKWLLERKNIKDSFLSRKLLYFRILIKIAKIGSFPWKEIWKKMKMIYQILRMNDYKMIVFFNFQRKLCWLTPRKSPENKENQRNLNIFRFIIGWWWLQWHWNSPNKFSIEQSS